MVVFSAIVTVIASLPVLALPDILSHTHKGVPIVAPPTPTNTGILPIPDPAHPFLAPRRNDIRGPCPGLNTLANHGFIPRNGIASFEEIVDASTHAFNMDYVLASALTAFGILSRGNAFVNKLSIGLQSPLVPPLPGQIDGPVTRGLAAHGRFELMENSLPNALSKCAALKTLELTLAPNHWSTIHLDYPNIDPLPFAAFLPRNLEHLDFKGHPNMVPQFVRWKSITTDPQWLPRLRALSFHLDYACDAFGRPDKNPNIVSMVELAAVEVDDFLSVFSAARPDVQIIKV